MRFPGSIGIIATAVYLILVGLVSLTSIAIPPAIIGVIALIAGIALLIGR